jgi:hypothetical protein
MPTQQQIAVHLDLDQSAVSRLLEKLELAAKTASMDEIRVAYIRQLRAQAAGHKSEDGLDLIRERVLTERIDRELKMLQVAEKRGLLINVDQLEPELMNMVGAFRSELLARDDKLASELSTLYGIDVDVAILNEHTFAALGQLARYEPIGQGDAAPTVVSADAAGAAVDDGMGAASPEDVG